MNPLTALMNSLKPFAIAASITTDYAIATSRFTGRAARIVRRELTSDLARDTYRIAWIGLQVAFWLTVAAGFYAIELAQKLRAYYEQEWVADVQWLISYPDSPATSVEAVVEAFLDDAIDLETAATAIGLDPDQVQAVIVGTGTVTNKLRRLASLAGLHWRNARGKGRHMSNANIRTGLVPLVSAELLAQLS